PAVPGGFTDIDCRLDAGRPSVTASRNVRVGRALADLAGCARRSTGRTGEGQATTGNGVRSAGRCDRGRRRAADIRVDQDLYARADSAPPRGTPGTGRLPPEPLAAH